MAERTSAAISPTAHYTGYVWVANGLSHDAFATRPGRAFYETLRPANAIARAIGQPSLEGLLLARHRVIDHLLEAAIADGRIGQVVEVAAGLSPRGWRFATRHGDALTYVEADLPGMVAQKRAILGALGGESAHHRVIDLDALADDGPGSIGTVVAGLDPTRGTAIITEGLLNYFDGPTVVGIWRRFARALAGGPRGLYLADLHIADDNRGPIIAAFQAMLGVFVRGRVHFHFADAAAAQGALVDAGFRAAALHRPIDLAGQVGDIEPGGGRKVRIIEATIGA
jgi:O-methyltransferase involved in polyketide biosynthesis